VAILTHTESKRGYEVIIGRHQHISMDERGSAALLSGV
jgi:threonine aldolase